MESMLASSFIGRKAELALLEKRLEHVAVSGAGTALAIRGRRQVGKSRLVQEFCNQADVPYVFFAATKGASPVEAVSEFLSELRDSSLPRDGHLVPSGGSGSWPEAFRALASALPDRPSIVVLDELPWLAEQDALFDGALQTAWDRLLSKHPVLLLLLGSDLHMMERLTAYDRPFYGRADNLTLGPLNPAETGEALGLNAGDALDAHLISGGLPGVLRTWPHATPALPFLEQVRRGRPEAAFHLIGRRWATWRGRAVEPLVRHSLELAAVDGALPWSQAETVGGWWNRQFDPEVDLVGADHAPVAGQISFIGSVQWLASPFDRHDLADLARSAPQVPGFTLGQTGLVVASLSGIELDADTGAVDLVWGPDQLIGAWR